MTWDIIENCWCGFLISVLERDEINIFYMNVHVGICVREEQNDGVYIPFENIS